MMVVKIAKPIHMALVEIRRPGLEEGRMIVNRSKVGVGKVDGVVRNGVSAIGQTVHAICENRRRKN
jgi:hypothetical protein